MKRIIYQVDSFTDEPFKGNPAGVVILDESMSDQWMQSVAAEMNLAETAFLTKNDKNYNIRFFTPTDEIALCGHATLASAHILYETGLEDSNDQITLIAKGGELHINKSEEFIVMKFPKFSLEKTDINPIFKELVGFQPTEMFKSDYGWVLAVASNQEEIINSKPEFDKLVKEGLGHLIITSISNSDEIDFVHRCFVPLVGINEDPVTGSAQCALVPLWFQKTGRRNFVAKQLSKRTGILKLKYSDDIIEISGTAITIFKAESYV